MVRIYRKKIEFDFWHKRITYHFNPCNVFGYYYKYIRATRDLCMTTYDGIVCIVLFTVHTGIKLLNLITL